MEEHPSCSSSSSLSASSYSSSTYSNPACSATTSIFSNLDDSKKSTNTEKCTKDLREQCWYWGAASKETISAAMENRQNGTFAVRDASTVGQYTLTLRIEGTNKLIKILVANDKCGFTADSLDFDTVPDLIKFYHTCSLRDFNERLDTCLLYPLDSPDWLARKAAADRSRPKSDREPINRINLLKCRLEGLHADYERVSRRYDQLHGQRTALAEEHKRKQQTAAAYADALKVFERKIGELRRTMLERDDLTDRDREALAMNAELQEERMEEIDKAQKLMSTAIQNIGKTLEKIDLELEEAKPRLLTLLKRGDKCRDRLLAMPNQQLQVTHAQLNRLVQGVSLSLDSEPPSLSSLLLRTPLPFPQWDCEQWFWHEGTTKAQASTLIQSLMWEFGEEEATDQQKEKPKDGIFLIRPSASRPGFYALEISQDGSVHSCLIEYRDPRAAMDHNGGYGFAHTQMLFASLVDFVRYYSQVPLKEHNSVLDTPLKEPALGLSRKREQKLKQKKQQKANARGSKETGEKEADENESASTEEMLAGDCIFETIDAPTPTESCQQTSAEKNASP